MTITPFRGSAAVAAGLITRGVLRGPRFRRMFTDVYVRADAADDLRLRSHGAWLLTRGRGVLGGWSAAELLGASCGPRDAPAEIVAPGGRHRSRPGLVVRADALTRAQTTTVAGRRVTTPVRTAADLARSLPLVEAVVAIDALAHTFGFGPAEVLALARPGGRGISALPEAVRLADPLAASPMETRIRLAIVLDGLPLPVLQHPVGPYHLDLAYPGIRLGIEYDGAEHLTKERRLRDLRRQAYLSGNGWEVLRFPAAVVHRPWLVAAEVHDRLLRAARTRGVPLSALDLR